MQWKHPPIIEIYEAFGVVADNHVEVTGNTGKVYSPSRNRHYDITYDPAAKAIMANDKGSYWRDYLGYPAIAFLLKSHVLTYSVTAGEFLKNINWGGEKTLDEILTKHTDHEKEYLKEAINLVDHEIERIGFHVLGSKVAPPEEGY